MTFTMPNVPKGRQANTRPQRWARACTNGLTAIAYVRENIADGFEDEYLTETNLVAMTGGNYEVAKALDVMEVSRDALEELVQEYQDWNENQTIAGPMKDKLEEISGLDVPELDKSTLDEIEEAFNNAEGMDLPRGYGKD